MINTTSLLSFVIENGATPKQFWLKVEAEDVIRLIMQYLRDCQLTGTLRELRRESGVRWRQDSDFYSTILVFNAPHR